MKTFWPTSQRAQVLLCFVLFVPTSLLLLSHPVTRAAGSFEHGLRGALAYGGEGLDLALCAAGWFLCFGGLMPMRRVANPRNDSLSLFFTNYLIFAFLMFFGLERLLGYAVLWSHLHWLAYRLKWIQMLSSMTVVAGSLWVLPHLRSLKERAATAQEEHDKFLAAAESSLNDFYLFDGVPDASGAIVDFRFAYINPNAERRLNTSRESLLGKILTEVRPFMITSGLIVHYREVVRTGIPYTCEVFIDDDMIKATWINVQVVKLGDGLAITSRDVTERKLLTDHVSYLAHHDQLTGLANRTLLQDRLEQAILRAQRRKHKIAVFMLDIDHFKHINDSLGHAGGDALLAVVSERLRSAVRETDTIARMGGDEFVIVMPEFKSLEDLKRCGQQIVEKAGKPIRIGDQEINITVSVGLCIYPDCAREAQELLKNADAAMYVVKDTGRNGLRIYTESMFAEVAENMSIQGGQKLEREGDPYQ